MQIRKAKRRLDTGDAAGSSPSALCRWWAGQADGAPTTDYSEDEERGVRHMEDHPSRPVG